MQVLILHGIQGTAGENWGQWLHDALLERSYTVIMPTLPAADHPDRIEWLNAIKDAVGTVPPEQLIIVGHSLGVTSALDYIEQSSGRTHALISVSGFTEDYGLELNSYFLREKTVDFDRVHLHLRRSAVLYGDDDPYVPQDVLQSLATHLGVLPAVIHHGGHLNATAGFTEFPALLQAVEQVAD